MDSDWRDVSDLGEELPDVFLHAVGRMALCFAALDVALAMFLIDSRASDLEFEELSLKPLEWKLRKIKKSLESKGLTHSISIDRIGKLAVTRNDLMHGIVFTELWASAPKTQNLSIWNPGRGTYRKVSLDNLDEISAEVRKIVGTLPSIADAVKRSP